MSKQSSTTIIDIAKALKVSPSTVSRALQDHPYISKETKKKVKKMADKLGYRRNTLAAGLRSRHSNTIGLIVPRISMYFQSTLVTAIQNTIRRANFNLIICQSNDSVSLEKELVSTLYDARVEGLIVSATMYTTDFSHFELFSDHQIPLVFYDRVPRDFPAQIIRGDDYNGGFQAGIYLASRGCRDIAYINGLLTCNLYQDRLKGLQDALRSEKIRLKKSRTFSHLLTRENALKTCKKLFKKEPYPDAIFCANDTTAIEIHRYVRELGLSIPRDIKIVGYSNDPRSEIITPSITTIEQYPSDMGTLAARSILELIQAGKRPEKRPEKIVPTDLIIRAST